MPLIGYVLIFILLVAVVWFMVVYLEAAFTKTGFQELLDYPEEKTQGE